MDKVKLFAERHVQWLVLAVALFYVGYTVLTYVVNAPLTVDLQTIKHVKPGDIDDTIKQKQIEPLQAEIANKAVSAPKVTDVLSEFDDRLNERRTEAVVMKNQWDAPFRSDGVGPTLVEQGPIVRVTQLPDLPPAAFKAASNRRTVLMAPGRKDTAYWSGQFTIDANALAQAVAKAFNNKGIPPNIFSTEFASVDLLREEQLSNGTWSAPVLIKPLFILEPFPADSAKNLADKAEMAVFFKYQHWMDQNQDLLARPPFLKTAGDSEPWIPPGGNPPMRAGTPAAGLPPAPAAGGANPAAVAGAPAANPNGVPPNGAFNAMLQPANPTITVHDITIEEGKIYRYAVRYKLYNPLFNNQVFAIPKIAAQFAILGPDPMQNQTVAWSGPVSVEPSSYVFVTKINSINGQAWFDIFEWKDGHWHRTAPVPPKNPLSAGDPISGSQGVSKYTLIDVRKESRNVEYGIVMDASGALQYRSVADDAADPVYAKLKAQAPVAAVGR